ncbi:hypothetical protein X942_5958 [Burkholderia pseudomallei MSHR5596]|nr:hypothetical protein X942_5958 [Burkholderia pseudomallei MSHR5596]
MRMKQISDEMLFYRCVGSAIDGAVGRYARRAERRTHNTLSGSRHRLAQPYVDRAGPQLGKGGRAEPSGEVSRCWAGRLTSLVD